jgi:uncharacterized protein YciI
MAQCALVQVGHCICCEVRVNDTKQLFAVIRTHGPAWRTGVKLEQQPAWDAHAAFMDDLADEGFALLAGPLGTDDALIVVRADTEQEIKARLAADPWTAMDLLRTTRIAPWTLRIGAL